MISFFELYIDQSVTDMTESNGNLSFFAVNSLLHDIRVGVSPDRDPCILIPSSESEPIIKSKKNLSGLKIEYCVNCEILGKNKDLIRNEFHILRLTEVTRRDSYVRFFFMYFYSFYVFT